MEFGPLFVMLVRYICIGSILCDFFETNAVMLIVLKVTIDRQITFLKKIERVRAQSLKLHNWNTPSSFGAKVGMSVWIVLLGFRSPQ